MKNNIEKAILLLNFMRNFTDDDHPLSLRDIKNKMFKLYDIKLSDETIRTYFRSYEAGGYEIISTKGKYAKHFFTGQILEKQERRLLIDAVNSFQLLPEDDTKKIVDKIKKLGSVYEGREIDSSMIAPTIAKSEAKHLLIKMNNILKAIESNHQISFNYAHYNKSKQLIPSDKIYTVSPFFFIWGYDRYYLYSWDKKPKTFRLDKMVNINEIAKKREHLEAGRCFNAKETADYVSKRIDMYDGEVKNITITIKKDNLDTFIDRFGAKSIKIINEYNNFLKISFEVAISNLLFGWLLGVGIKSIDGSGEVKEAMHNFIKNINSAL